MMGKLSLMVLAVLWAGPAWAQATIPDTPAGHVLSAWLDAFNSGDRAKIDLFAQTYDPLHAESIATSAQFRGRSGGVELVGIDRSEPFTILFRGKEKTQPTLLLGKIELSAGETKTIQNFNLRALPPGSVSDNVKLDAGLRKQAIEDVITNLNQYYVYPEMAVKMADALHAHEQKGDYNAITDGDVFANALTTNLLDVSHDKHLHVFFNPYKLPTEPPNVTPEQMAESRRAMAKDCGFRKVDILPNNIGYLKFDYFADPMGCGRTAGAAMVFFASVDAVIIDLRDNTGGDPRMVAFMCTYLFDKPTHLDDIYERKANTTTENWTLRFVPGSRLGAKPVYILMSNRTFSGAEEFAYDLKNLKRAKIVGEQSAGGSHPVNAFNAGDHFTIFVPGARTVNFVSKKDWEGTGVTPDVVVRSEDALETAARLAAQEIEESVNRATSNSTHVD